MGLQSAGSKDAEAAAAAGAAVHFAGAAVSDSAVQSIFQVKQVEEGFASVFPMSPDLKYAEGEAAAAAAVSEPATFGLIHFDR